MKIQWKVMFVRLQVIKIERILIRAELREAGISHFGYYIIHSWYWFHATSFITRAIGTAEEYVNKGSCLLTTGTG